MKHYWVIFLILVVKWGVANDHPFIKYYGISDGLLTNTVYHVSQDRDGFLWFSTDAGVIKYNGSIYRDFRKKDGITDKNILRTQEDSFGRTWIFSFNGNLQFHLNSQIYNQSNTDYLKAIDSKEFIIGFYEDQNGTLYFCNSHGLIFSLDNRNVVQKFSFPDIGRLFFITRTRQNEFLFVTANGLYITKNLATKPVNSMHLNILNIFQASGTNFTILTATDELISFDHEKPMLSIKNPLNTQKLITVLNDHAGFLWIGTFDQGVYCLKDGKIISNLPIRQSQMIFEDISGNIWITSMNEGIYKIQPGYTSVTHIPCAQFMDNGISDLSPGGSNEVWISNGKAIFYYSKGRVHPFYPGIGNLHIDILTGMKEKLFFGKKNDALYAIDLISEPGSSAKPFKQVGEPRLVNPYVKSFSMNSHRSQLCLQQINELFVLDHDNPGQPERIKAADRIYFTYFNRHDELIINSNQQISILSGGTMIPYPGLSWFYGRKIEDHVNLSSTVEVFNIEGDSLWLLTDDALVNLSKRLNLTLNHPIIHLLYRFPNLYFTSGNQIYRIEIPANYTASKAIEAQMLDVRFNSIHAILFQNDTLFIGSDDGLTLISPSEFDHFSNNVPKPYFIMVQSGEKQLNFSEGTEIFLRGNNSLHIDFDAINYSGSGTVFSYKLEGLEKNWNTGPETSVVYKNLSPQNYTFKLKAGSFGTNWSSEAQLQFIIKPAIYQRLSFIIISSLILLALIYFASRMYITRLKKSQELKTRLVTYEQKALQSMMNPHFIFNSLGSIQNYLLQNRSNEASAYLSQFARLIRQNLNSANSAFISIEDETDRLMNYLSLEKLRLDDKFDFRITVDDTLHTDEVMIPSMVIQPFVENAVWHGISPMNQKGKITISLIRQSQSSLLVTIEDNGIGMGQSSRYFSRPDHVSMGMETTRKRLSLICRQHKLKFEISHSEVRPDDALPGTIVKFNIPFVINEE